VSKEVRLPYLLRYIYVLERVGNQNKEVIYEVFSFFLSLSIYVIFFQILKLILLFYFLGSRVCASNVKFSNVIVYDEKRRKKKFFFHFII